MNNCICIFPDYTHTHTLQTMAKMTWSIYPANTYHFDQIISFRCEDMYGRKKKGYALFYLLTKKIAKRTLNVSPWNILFLRSSIFEHCSSTLPWGLKQATFNKIFIRDEWTAPQTDSWGRKSWGALAIMIYLEDLQQLQKVLQAILKHRKRTLLEGYAGISETTILFYIR